MKWFEGFQGSGRLALVKRPSGAGGGITATSSSGFHSRFGSQSQESREGHGHLVSAPPRAEEDDEVADLDGGLYAHKKSKGGTQPNGSSHKRNRTSLNRTSASTSDQVHHISPLPNLGGPTSKHSSISQSRSESNTSLQSLSHHHLPHPSRSATRISWLRLLVRVPSSRDRGFSIWRMSCL